VAADQQKDRRRSQLGVLCLRLRQQTRSEFHQSAVSQCPLLALIFAANGDGLTNMNTTSKEQSQSVYALHMKQIVVAIDLSPHSKKTVAYAVEIARIFGATIYLVYIHALPESQIEYTTQPLHEYLEEERRGLEQELRNLCEKTRQIYPNCGFEFRVGNPADQVSQLAHTLDADLIITASYHTSFLGGLFNLGQAPKIMHRAPCSVLVYHDQNH
jgi:nucleotide-binding universal stress UspA family protein